MKNFISSMAGFIREEEGASAVEYGILVAMIAVAVVAVVYAVGQEVSGAFQSVVTCMQNKNC